ncbi:uncharacterized protein LOC129984067 [Argiope bruennichi]|uniref:uncharacterized protein LOC129984067 n=1 Tax=Argiope bruennichi TaxID=94029 RepID=UPI002495303B|nr:uncharacterized protein LOC129984067 [Argiope bruennichi]
MILFLLAFLTLSKASLGDVICQEDIFESCPRPKLFSMVPVDKAEYDALCPFLKDYIMCLGRFQKDCTTKFFATPEEYTSILTAFSEFCEEGSLLNIIVTENLKCLNESLGNSFCTVQANTMATTFEDLLSVVTETDAEIPHVGSVCLRESFLVACTADEIAAKCSSLVKDAALEMIQRSYLIQEACSLEDIINILENGSLVELTPSYQEILNNALEQMS